VENKRERVKRDLRGDFEWRCTGCELVLGVGIQDRLYISYRGGQYATQLPVEAVCRRCDAYNETTFLVQR
jgi:hypothetical protein